MLNRLAGEGYEVHFMEPGTLINLLDDSPDLPQGKDMNYFDDLLIMKYMEIPPRLHDDLDVMGIETPVLVDVEDGHWVLADGHHRLAWAVITDNIVPLLFVDEQIDPLSLYSLLMENETFYDYV